MWGKLILKKQFFTKIFDDYEVSRSSGELIKLANAAVLSSLSLWVFRPILDLVVSSQN